MRERERERSNKRKREWERNVRVRKRQPKMRTKWVLFKAHLHDDKNATFLH